MEDNFYAYMFGENKKQEQAAEDSKPETVEKKDDSVESTVVQDEAIGKPWTHRYTIYCADPASDFLENLKKNGCVVAVYEKVKETAEPPSDKEEPPTNE
jgi:Mn-containing catalase